MKTHHNLLKFIIVFILSAFLILSTHAQENISWQELAEVEWQDRYDTLTGFTLIDGIYSDHLKSLDSTEVYISGYVIPFDALGFSFALSRTSFASCFFCGQAGPETVLSLRIKPNSIEPSRQKNTKIKFKGLFRVHESNENGFHYELLNAEEVN